MNPLVTFRVAVRALLRHKMRALLTMLGIMIGVGAVIAMVAFGEGAKAQVAATFNSMGTNLLVLMAGSTRGGGMQGGAGSASTLTWDDLTAIKTQVGTVRAIAPALRANTSLVAEDANWTTSVYGTTPEFFDVRNWAAGSGALFGKSEVDGGAKVVVIGATVADKLFGASDPIGQVIRRTTTTPPWSR